jgi:hypothetical protein
MQVAFRTFIRQTVRFFLCNFRARFRRRKLSPDCGPVQPQTQALRNCCDAKTSQTNSRAGELRARRQNTAIQAGDA